MMKGLGIGVLVLVILTSLSGEISAQRKKKKSKKTTTSVSKPFKLSKELKQKVSTYLIVATKHYAVEDFKKSKAEYEKVIAIEPSNAAAHYKLAQINLLYNELDKAYEHANKSVSYDNTNKFYYLKKAEIERALSKFEEAATTYETLIKEVPGTHQYLYNLAATYRYAGQQERELEVYDRIEKEYGKSQEILLQKQQILLRSNRLDDLISEYQKYINSFPDVVEYRLGLSDILTNNGRHDKAVVLLNETRGLFPNETNVLLALSEVYRKSNRINEAIEILRSAFADPSLSFSSKIQVFSSYFSALAQEEYVAPLRSLGDTLTRVHPEEANSHILVGDLNVRLGEKEKALENYKKAIQLSQENFNIWRNILQLSVELKDFDVTTEFGERSVEYFPNQAMLYYLTGIAYYSKQNFDEAIRVLETGSRFAKHDPDLYSYFQGQLGDSYNGVGNNEKSDMAYDKALKAKPNNDHVLNNYSYFLSIRKERLDYALKLSSQLIGLHPESSTFLDTHGWVLYVKGDYQEAEKYLKRAAESSQNGTILEHYGDVVYRLGDIDLALEYWKKAKETEDDVSDFLEKKIKDAKLYE